VGRAIEFDVRRESPPLKGEAKSMLSRGHGQAPRVRALLEAAYAAKQRSRFDGFGAARIGMAVVVRPVGGSTGDATNALGGIGDTLQSRRSNIDLSHLGELADAFLYADDAQLREVSYREEFGETGYTLRFWEL
jgi:hypothetical protein